jgi:hypothetical protein
MVACMGWNLLLLFKLIKYKIVVFDEVYILFHFNKKKFYITHLSSFIYI